MLTAISLSVEPSTIWYLSIQNLWEYKVTVRREDKALAFFQSLLSSQAEMSSSGGHVVADQVSLTVIAWNPHQVATMLSRSGNFRTC